MDVGLDFVPFFAPQAPISHVFSSIWPGFPSLLQPIDLMILRASEIL
jgi:hypothetical protein